MTKLIQFIILVYNDDLIRNVFNGIFSSKRDLNKDGQIILSDILVDKYK